MNIYSQIKRSLPPLSCGLILCTACAPLSDIPKSGMDQRPIMASYEVPYTLAPLDELQLTYRDGHSILLALTVEDKVTFPIGSDKILPTLNRNPEEVKREIKKRDPAVAAISVVEFKGNRISVTGEVNIQTNFDLQDAPMRVLDAIASAGGFTPLANRSTVRLIRHNSGKIEIFNLNMRQVEQGRSALQDMLLEPGDRIFVPKSFL